MAAAAPPPPAIDSASLAGRVLQQLQCLSLMVLDQTGRVCAVNDSAERWLGEPRDALLGRFAQELPRLPDELCQQLASSLAAPDQHPSWSAELEQHGPLGTQTLQWHLQVIAAAQRGDPWHLAVTALDISAERQAREREALQSQALHSLVYEDELTGLASRYSERERILGLIEQAQPFGLMAVKLRDFSLLRDNFGPEGADEVLRSAAEALAKLVEPPLLLSRATGVEFHIIVPGSPEPAELQRLGRSILQRFALPLQLNKTDLVISVSIGIACHPQHGNGLEELQRNVGTALHSAEEDGGRVQRVFEPKMQQRARERLWLDHHLRKALELQQLELHYQPKVSLQGDAAPTVEALLRWRHPKRGLVRPDQFIARAEDNGQIIAMGRWVIVSAAAQAAQWLAKGHAVRVAINISARQLADADLLRWLSECQRIAHGLLDVELTESCVIDDERATHAFMQECRTLGYQVFLDDFGTGFSSLAQLARLPIDVVKLDRSFVVASAQGRSQALMRSMVGVARELDLKVIAEGVETREQEALLREMGVHGAQGWLYAAAMPADDYLRWLGARQTSSTDPGAAGA